MCSYCNIELAILLDSSSKSIANAWTQMQEFAVSVVTGYNINSNCVRVAVIHYNDQQAIYTVSLQTDSNTVQTYIRGLSLLNGGSNLENALNTLRTRVFTSGAVRSGAALLAVVVTDNLQPSSGLTNEANLAKAQGITIIAVGITRQGRVDTTTLYAVASRSGSVTYANTVSDYTQLPGAVSSVTQQWGCFLPTPRPTPSPVGGMYIFTVISNIISAFALMCCVDLAIFVADQGVLPVNAMADPTRMQVYMHSSLMDALIRSPGTTVPDGLIFCRRCFFSPRVLRAPSTDRPETLPHGRNLA